MWKVTLLLAILVVSSPTEVEIEEADSEVQTISNFLVNLIGKYDDSGIGAIPIGKYPNFLTEVFMTGHYYHYQTVIDKPTEQMLLEATKGFAGKYNGTEVGIQDFYTDLIKDFTVYLQANTDQYQSLLDLFFSPTPDNYRNQQQEQPKPQTVQL